MKSISTCLFVSILSIALSGCLGSGKSIQTSPTPTMVTEIDTLPGIPDDLPFADGEELLIVEEPPEIYQSKPSKKWELIHTDLELSFDWIEQWVHGLATLTVSPWFYQDSILVLDAKNFDFHYVGDTTGKMNYTYEYDSLKLVIHLGKAYQKTDTLHLRLGYVAKPAARKSIGGSTAITSDQGLFFINHDSSVKGKPQQIWTQGETSYNSCWFPTIDAPNQRHTHDIKLIVENRFTTLSNGKLISQSKALDTMRMDHWRMDMSHAPYLTMIAVGEFAVVRDQWKDLELGYYVEPEYKDHAKDIFAHTPEMLTFFSEKFGVPYPWQKYDQVVVRDYVSGAMENTTAVIFGDFVQRTRRQLMDDGNDKIVAHEMAHHWFGDLVTCADWSQLTMNEGFANYSEYLWLEHKYGLADAEIHRREELDGYLQSIQYTGTKHLIRYNYQDEEEMFDAHSYNKGGLVLHMLRKLIGEDAFFASLERYLKKNAYSAVEVHQLRLAVEEVTGIDYSWFFNQWFLDKGHPELRVDQFFDEVNNKLYISAHQIQDAAEHRAIFKLPIDVDIYLTSGKKIRHQIMMNERSVVEELQLTDPPVDVIFDPDYTLLATIEENWELTDASADIRLNRQDNYIRKLDILEWYAGNDMEAIQGKADELAKDPYWGMRQIGVALLPEEEGVVQKLLDFANNDPHVSVRAIALERLKDIEEAFDPKPLIEILKKGENENGLVIANALTALFQQSPELAEEWIVNLESDDDAAVITAIAEIIAQTGDTSKVDYLLEKYRKIEGYEAITYMSALFDLTADMPESSLVRHSNHLTKMILEEDTNPLQRYGAMQYIASNMAVVSNKMRSEEVDDMIQLTKYYEQLLIDFEKIVREEKSSQLKSAYEFLRP